jgi:acetylornithine/succinyldiaminopimelate/putrescine aminotransferase
VPFGDLAAARERLSERTAAIIVEPVQGESGVRPAPPGFLQGLRELADEFGCLLIFDEVQTGIGRTGPLFAHQASGVEPDIMTLAKALGNGIPIGAMLTRSEIGASLVPGTHASTFGGNPLAAACACAVLDTLTLDGVLEEAGKGAEHLTRELDAMAERLGPDRVVEVRGSGHLRAVELTQPASGIVNRCREAGVLVISAGPMNIRLAPPLIIREEEIDEGLSVLEAAITAEIAAEIA